MILPIVAYGNPILRKVGKNITSAHPGLHQLIEDMWETMYNSKGVGLAAPQVNNDIRLFVMDSIQIIENLEKEDKNSYPGDDGYKGVFINAKLNTVNGEDWSYNEGCLSIPKIREDIIRKEIVDITFLDEHFNSHTKTFNGITARLFYTNMIT